MSLDRDDLTVLQVPSSGRLILCACVHGDVGHSTLYLDKITPEYLRELADEMDRKRGLPVLSDAAKIQAALQILEAYDPHEDNCCCDLCLAMGTLRGAYIPKLKETA